MGNDSRLTTFLIPLGTQGKTGSSFEILRFEATGNGFKLPAGLAGARIGSRVAAAAAAVFSVRKNTTEIGTISWAIGATRATIAGFATETTFAPSANQNSAGDVLIVVAPAIVDANLSDIAGNFLAVMS
ncbi:hypothetical protein EON80_10765 [bacterium]|nr:MAG: hypothetical protein EON80_10765 [bacterium]